MYILANALQCLGILVAFAGLIYIYPKRPTKQKYLLDIILISIIINEMGYLFELQSTTMEAALVAIKVAYVGKMIAELGILVFVLHYADIRIPNWLVIVLSSFHLGIIGLVWTCEYNDLYYASIGYTQEGLYPHVVLTYGVIYNLFTVVTVLYMVIILAICIIRFIQRKEHKERMRMVFLSTPPITFMLGLFIFRTGIMKGYDTTALSYLICAVMFIYTMARFDLTNEKEVVEELLLEEFSEPVFVIGKRDKVVYVNKQFEALYSDYKKPEVRQTIEAYCESQEELEIGESFFHIISKELIRSGEKIGCMYVLHDVTQAHMRMQMQMELKIKEEKMIQQKKQSDEMTLLLIKTLSQTIEAKDEYTRGHSYRVSEYAMLIAKKMGMSEEEASKIRYASTLHDIGKIGVPDTILNKPSRLTDEEYSVIKTHSSIGADILESIEELAYTADIARHHHERYDGKGYPDGLKGEEISIGARIVAVADSFDAMNSRRIYRNSLDMNYIKGELEKCKGTQFDPNIADALLELIDEGAIDKIVQEDNNKNAGSAENGKNAGKILSAFVDTMKNSGSSNQGDILTGLSTRAAGEEKIVELMKNKPGALIFCDMDNLKTINDRFGHKCGDKALKTLGEVIGKYGEMGAACRVGGDEFLLYLDGANEKVAVETVENLAEEFKKQLEGDATINLATLSMGVCLSQPTDIYTNVLNKADKALYHVKQRGKAGYYIYHDEMDNAAKNNHVDINEVTKSIVQAGKYDGALDVEYRQFAKMYDYLIKVCQRYKHSCNVVLVTLDSKNNSTMYIDNIEQSMHYMEMAIKNTIRNVDICTRYSSVQFLIILLESEKDSIDTIMNRIFTSFYKMNSESDLVPRYEISELFEERD